MRYNYVMTTYVEDKMKELTKAIKGRVSIYIDAANLEQSVKSMFVHPKDIPDEFKAYKAGDLAWHVDYDKFKKFFSLFGKLKDIHYYTAEFKTDSHKKFLAFLKNRLDFHLNTKPLKEYKDHTPEVPHRKANFDVEMSIESVLNRNTFDTFIIFSGDCDFEFLLKYLRGQGKICIVFSTRGNISEELPPASSYYFDIIDFRKNILRITPKKPDAKNPAL